MSKCENAEMSKCENTMLVRIAEIEVNEGYLGEYLSAAHNVGTKSVESEPGVICIFPMQVKDSPNTIRILEIYRNDEAYQAHLQTAHFLDKQGLVAVFAAPAVLPIDRAMQTDADRCEPGPDCGEHHGIRCVSAVVKGSVAMQILSYHLLCLPV